MTPTLFSDHEVVPFCSHLTGDGGRPRTRRRPEGRPPQGQPATGSSTFRSDRFVMAVVRPDRHATVSLPVGGSCFRGWVTTVLSTDLGGPCCPGASGPVTRT